MKNKPKILLFDIETAPNLAYVWGKYEQDVISYDRDWYMLCFAYKWLGEKQIKAKALPDYSLYKKNKIDDKELVKDLIKLFDEADIIIGHNCSDFDIKKTNARAFINGLNPPSPYKIVDTKTQAKRIFKLDSNSLSDISRQLGLGHKDDTGGFDLWLGCMSGETTAWRNMVRYNKQDVNLLEKVYLKMRPWMPSHPNVTIYQGTTYGCPACGSTKLQRRGFGITSVRKVQRYQCTDCGKWSTGESIKPSVVVR